MNHTEPTRSEEQLWIGVLLIVISIPLLMRGIKHGNMTMTTGITILSRYFSLEEHIMEMANSVKFANDWIPWEKLGSFVCRVAKP